MSLWKGSEDERGAAVRMRRRYGRRHDHRRGLREVRPAGRRWRVSNRPVYKRRRRIALLCITTLLTLTLLLPLALSNFGNPMSGELAAETSFSRVEPPVFSTAPVAANTRQEENTTPPKDETLYLTVPKIGVYGHTVQNDDSQAALDAGAIKIPETGFPWQDGANTYISGHRVGYRNTQSYYQFLDLPSMKSGDEVIVEDSEGGQYVYEVFDVFAVEPSDTWVTEPVEGKDIVTLQTCTETVDDWQTIGPEVMVSGPDTGRLIVRAERV